MPYNAEKKLLGVKIEATSGTYEEPVGANVLEVLNLSGDRGAKSVLERQIDNGKLGSKKSIRTPMEVPLSFGIELRGGGGAVDDLTQLDPVLRMMGFSSTVNAATNVQYDPVDNGAETASVLRHHDTLWIKSAGNMADGSLEFTAGQVPMLNVNALGLDNAHGDTAQPAAAPVAAADPLEVSKANTVATIDGHAAAVESLTININRNLEFQNIINQERIKRGDRVISGSVNLVLPDLATKDYLQKAIDGDEVALSLVHGTTAGNIIEIAGAQVQLSNGSFSDGGDQLMASFDVQFNVTNAGQDDIQILTR